MCENQIGNNREVCIRLDNDIPDHKQKKSWTFLIFKRSASVKYTAAARVKLRLFRVYMSSQEPPKKKSKRGNRPFCLYSECTWMSCILCQHASARTIWKNTRL